MFFEVTPESFLPDFREALHRWRVMIIFFINLLPIATRDLSVNINGVEEL